MRGENSVRKYDGEILPVPRVLSTLYKEDEIVTTGVVVVSPTTIETHLRFPSYGRSKAKIDYVSAIQVGAAIVEAFYSSVENAIKNGAIFPKAMTLEWFERCALDFLVFKNHVIFRKRIRPDEIVPLIATVVDVGEQRLRKRMLSVTVSFEGFCSGEMVCVLDLPSVTMSSPSGG